MSFQIVYAIFSSVIVLFKLHLSQSDTVGNNLHASEQVEQITR